MFYFGVRIMIKYHSHIGLKIVSTDINKHQKNRLSLVNKMETITELAFKVQFAE